MPNKLKLSIKSLLRTLVVIGLVITLAFGNASNALAAGSGGRIGGGSFRMPSRSYSMPSRGYSGGGYYSPYGGSGFNFVLPFFMFGGGFGNLFTILIFLAIGNFLFQSFRKFAGDETGENNGFSFGNEQISVAQVQVGLLSQGRYLQTELNKLALTADTESDQGRAQVLQEASLALLRHPEYWAYSHTSSQKVGLQLAEAKFNQLSLAERSKFSEETLVNVNNQLRQATENRILTGEETRSEYIVATILVGVQGTLELPKINSSNDLRQALRQIGSIGSDRLLAMEILWTPQANGDTLTSDDLMAEYPDLIVL
jgi:uncharacterized membrane protein